MKIKHLVGYVAISSSFLLSACAPSDMQAIIGNGTAVSNVNVKLAAVDQNKVRLYFGNQNLPKHYRIIGHVSADNYSMIGTPHSQVFISDQLKKQAASIGGTGVININSVLDRTTGDVIVR